MTPKPTEPPKDKSGRPIPAEHFDNDFAPPDDKDDEYFKSLDLDNVIEPPKKP